MRKTIIGAVLAGVLAAAGCTAAQKAAPATSPAPQGPMPDQNAAREIKPGFVGQQQIGAWTLICDKIPDNSAPPPANGNPIESQIVKKGGQQTLDVKIHVPPRPCLVRDVLGEADQPGREAIATFRLRGAYGILTLVFRGRPEIFPLSPLLPKQGGSASKSMENGKSSPTPGSDKSPADLANLNYDGKTLTSPTMICGLNYCIAGIEIPQEDEPAFLAAKDIVLQLPPVSGKPPFRVIIPTTGLADAVGAMRRMEK